MNSNEISRPIYLDYNATTPMDARVAEVMRPLLTSCFGNPSSGHFFGQEAKAVIEKARHQVAKMLEVTANQIVFTSGGTESNNHAIMGAALGNTEGKKSSPKMRAIPHNSLRSGLSIKSFCSW